MTGDDGSALSEACASSYDRNSFGVQFQYLFTTSVGNAYSEYW